MSNYNDNFRNEINDSDDWIIDRKFRELQQDHFSSFGKQSALGVVASSQDPSFKSECDFTFNSTSNEYADLEELYFQSYFKGVCTDQNDVPLRSYLDVGGIIAMIDELEVSIGSQIIERISEYSKLNSAISLMTDNPNYVDYNLMKSGDSIENYYFSKADQYVRDLNVNELDVRYIKEGDPAVFTQLSLTANETHFDFAGGAFYANRELRLSDPAGGNNGDAAGNVDAGDLLLCFNVSTQNIVYARVETTPTDNNYIQITEGSAISAFRGVDRNVVDNVITRFDAIYVIDADDLIFDPKLSTRARVMNQEDEGIRLTWRLRLDSLNKIKRLPMPLMKQKLKITIRWKEAELGIVVRDASDVNVNNKIGYKITAPRIICQMLEVSYEDMERHRAILENGLYYLYSSWEHDRRQVERSIRTKILSLKKKYRSINYVLMVLTDEILANIVSLNSQNYAGNSTFYKNFLESARIRIGSDHYPKYGDVNVKDIFASEAMELTKLALTGQGEFDSNLRIFSYDWQDRDSEKFVLAIPVSIIDRHFGGRNIMNDIIEIKLQYSNSPANLVNDGVLHIWIHYDAVLRITDTECEVIV